MLKNVMTVLFGLSLLVVSACAERTGSARAEEDDTGVNPFEKVGVGLVRDVDCEAGVVIYSSTSKQGGVAVISFIDVDPIFVKNKCGLK